MKTLPLRHYDHKLSSANPFLIEFIRRKEPMKYPVLPDIHGSAHFGFIVSGTINAGICGQKFELGKGSSYLTAPWEPHGTFRHSKDFELILITFSEEEMLKSFFGAKDLPRRLIRMRLEERMNFLQHQESAEIISNTFENLKNSTMCDDITERMQQWNIITGMFIKLVKKTNSETSGNELSADQQRMSRAVELISRSSGRQTTLSEAAKACSLSPSRFNHIFKRTFGIPFAKYEVHYRLNNAADTISRENIPIKELAEMWGFYDESHFIHKFKKHFSVTPGRFRKVGK